MQHVLNAIEAMPSYPKLCANNMEPNVATSNTKSAFPMREIENTEHAASRHPRPLDDKMLSALLGFNAVADES